MSLTSQDSCPWLTRKWNILSTSRQMRARRAAQLKPPLARPTPERRVASARSGASAERGLPSGTGPRGQPVPLLTRALQPQPPSASRAAPFGAAPTQRAAERGTAADGLAGTCGGDTRRAWRGPRRAVATAAQSWWPRTPDSAAPLHAAATSAGAVLREARGSDGRGAARRCAAPRGGACA